jgi:hypothetical protein
MTSWQNILDHLPTGTGRPTTQNNNKNNDDSIQRTPNKNLNDNEGRYFHQRKNFHLYSHLSIR